MITNVNATVLLYNLYYNNWTVWLSVCVTTGLGWAGGLAGQGPSAPGLVGHVGWLAGRRVCIAARRGHLAALRRCYHEHEAQYTGHNRTKRDCGSFTS